MNIKPILSALGRHRIATTLIVVEIALACAVLCNAFFLFSARLDLMRIDSGVDEAALATIKLSDCEACTNADLNGRVLSALRAVPGVRAAGALNAMPFGQRAGDAGITLDTEGKHFGPVTHFYTLTPSAIETLGLTPVQGRSFGPSDFAHAEYLLPSDAQVWVTRSLADRLWPGADPLGREFWLAKYHLRVAGVVAHFARPDPGRSESGTQGAEWAVLVPVSPDSTAGTYVLRADPADLPQVMESARAAIARAAPEAILDRSQSRPLGELRTRYFQRDRAMAWLLASVIAAMLLVTALGIVGLASFWVAQRTKQIGIRRALGATRGDILRYFQIENFLLASGGIVLGMLLAYGGNLLLMKYFELARLPPSYLPAGALLLWLVGQLAVLGPALRAASIPPVVATRSA